MNCKTVAENMPGIVSGELNSTMLADCEQHIRHCENCRDALRGAESLALLKERPTAPAPEGLFERMASSLDWPAAAPRRHGFWMGTGFGGAVAASLLALAVALGWIGPAVEEDGAVADFVVALGEPRSMDIAIETDRALAGANISIVLSGGIELDGYGHRRELSWTTDLEAGVNRLSLPVRAIDPAGGQMVVRLDHPDSEQIFVVRLNTEA